jgi:hypothetical protein
MSAIVLAPLAVLAALIGVAWWVYTDARQHLEAGKPVVFRAGSFVMDTPAMWSLGCLALWIVFFPLYVATRA